MELGDKVAVVTGGGSGIGRALCEAFAREGARAVAVADRDAAAAAAVAEGVGGVAYTVDVRDETQLRDMVADVEARFGRIDLFCSNAGIIAGDGEPWYATSAPNETWQAMWEVHVMAHVYAARACLPAMLARGEGYFLNTASAAGLLNQIGDAAYSTTKHAAVGFAEALAITHGDDGIRVSCLCPQAVATPMIGAMEDGGTAGVDGVLSARQVAEEVIEGLRLELFLILPHKAVADYRRRKAEDYDRWLGGMRKLRRRFGNPRI
jgi:NAD(P)-dependent dehydrogenase (short-subunit alcohol dehydrogenase family)